MEKILAKQGASDTTAAGKVRDAIKRLFRKRACMVLAKPGEGPIQSESDLTSQCREQLTAAVDFIRSNCACKRVAGKYVSGAVVCNMAQDFIHRFQKPAPLLLIRAFERAVAAEARRHKEKLLISYLDRMGRIEKELPVDEEKLAIEYQTAIKELLGEFDRLLLPVANQAEVLEERNSLVERMESMYQEVREANANSSLEDSKYLFRDTFETLKNERFPEGEDGLPNITEFERRWRTAIQTYQDKARGPNREYVFQSEFPFIVTWAGGAVREMVMSFARKKEDLEQSVEQLTKHRDEARAGESRLKQVLADSNKAFEKQLEQKDQLIVDLQASVNARILQAENKAREQAREIQTLRVELEQAKKERELMLEKERDMFEKRLSDLEGKLHKAQNENSRLEQALDDAREEHDKLLSEKNEAINQLARQLKVLELQPEAAPRQDSSLLRTMKQYLEDIMSHFENEQTARNKNIGLLDQISRLQSELNQVRLKDHEAKMELIEEYEHKLRDLRLERETAERQAAASLSRCQEEMSALQETLRLEAERRTKHQAELETRLKRLEEERTQHNEEFRRREQQLEDQYSVLAQQVKTIEGLRSEMDDKDMAIAKLMTGNEAEKDDNDLLIQMLGILLEFHQKKRGVIPVSHIHNEENKGKLLALLAKYKVPHE